MLDLLTALTRPQVITSSIALGKLLVVIPAGFDRQALRFCKSGKIATLNSAGELQSA